MGKFIFKAKNALEEGLELDESDLALLDKDNKFWQWTYVPDKSDELSPVSPGVFSLSTKDGDMVNSPTEFNVAKNIMEDYIHTKDLTDKIDHFFNKLHIYQKYGVFPKRGILLHGPQGSGKSLILSKVSQTYAADGETVVLYWPTDRFKASDVKYHLKRLAYEAKCKKLIFIIEDIGGVSIDTGGQKLSVEPSLLSILDNVESVFKIPTLILATTNFPENLLANIANRPKRFDYIHSVGNPSDEARSKFLEFFSQGIASEEELLRIKHKDFKDFSIAHIEEVVIRAELEDVSISVSMELVLQQSKIAANSFMKEANKLGF
jgi:ATP-dependent 26S proteasome regulatory subunit